MKKAEKLNTKVRMKKKGSLSLSVDFIAVIAFWCSVVHETINFLFRNVNKE